MAAANTDKVRKVVQSFTTTLSAPGISNSDTNIPLPSQAAAALPTDTAVTITIDRVDSSGTRTPTLREDITGVADPANNRITSALRGQSGTNAQSHNTGAVVEITWTQEVWNDMVDAFLAEHEQDGSHKDTLFETILADNLIGNGNFHNNSTNGYGGTPDDWTNSSANPVQGGFPVFTKAWLMDILGIADGDIEALYSLNGNFTDLSSNGYNLTASGSPTDSDDGLIGQAKVFASASTQYATGAAANAKLTGSQTFFGFVKPTTIGAQNPVIGFADSDASDFKFLSINTIGQVTFRLDGLTTNFTITGDIKLQANKWYFLAGVYDSSATKLKVWVNGVKQEVTASGSASAGTSSNLSIGRLGDYTTDKANSTIQACGVLSVALSDAQVRRLWSATTWKGIKTRRASSDGYVEYAVPEDKIEFLRGKTITLRAEVYQGVTNTAQLEINDGSSTTSTVNTTVNSWQTLSVTKTISSTATSIKFRLKNVTTNGSNWWKQVAVYLGDKLYPYQPSKEDWARFPRLLRLLPPSSTTGFEFEEGREFTFTPVDGGVSVQPTYDCKYSMVGYRGFLTRNATGNGTGSTTAYSSTLPFIPSVGVNHSSAFTSNNGTLTEARVKVDKDTATFNLYTSLGGGSWTASGNRYADLDISLAIY